MASKEDWLIVIGIVVVFLLVSSMAQYIMGGMF